MNKKFCEEIVKIIAEKKPSGEELEKIKAILSKKYGLDEIPKNADIRIAAEKMNLKDKKKIFKNLKTKPIRTGSGVAIIAVMFLSDCPGSCIYCPRGENAPQSYTGSEPATMRAQLSGFDPYRQVKNRLRQLKIIGHETDKCELIVMGGTFPALPFEKQKEFVKKCFDGMNDKKSMTLKQAQKINEKSRHRCVGLTIETRPDYCLPEHIEKMLELGCTRVELGVQTIYPELLKKISRGHDMEEVKKAVKNLKNCGLKVCLHMMPGLTGLERLDMKKELRQMEEIFINEGYKPDELKIYPTLVIPGTKLYRLWKQGKYQPISNSQMAKLLAEIKSKIPEYVRIKRVMRDISEKEVVAGARTTNLRQLVQESGTRCMCIRCREPKEKNPGKVFLHRKEYMASGANELFLYIGNKKYIVAFLRLRLIKNKALVRELHVYGPMAAIGKRGCQQHRGYGRKLLKEAEKIAIQNNRKIIQVTSGIGVREYYRKLGYRRDGFFMTKIL